MANVVRRSGTWLRALVAVICIAVSGAVAAEEAGALFEEGADLLNAGRATEAIQRFEQVLRQSPDDPTAPAAWFFMGKAYISLSKWDAARDALNRAASMDTGGKYATAAKELLMAIPRHTFTFRDCDDCPEMVFIPSGIYVMGSPRDETERDANEGPIHVVTITYAMAVGKFEVTFEQWNACAQAGGCRKGDGKREAPGYPVVEITWDAARQYTDWLAEKTGKRYRLLTEAEWEYAARAGTETARYWGNSAARACEFANVANPSTTREFWWKKEWGEPHTCEDGYGATDSPPGKFKPNAFGLYDMLGNEWEWTQDCYVDSYAGAPTDGSAVERSGCEKRVLRGGGYGDKPRGVRSAIRYGLAPSTQSNDIGFRVARTLR